LYITEKKTPPSLQVPLSARRVLIYFRHIRKIAKSDSWLLLKCIFKLISPLHVSAHPSGAIFKLNYFFKW